MGAKKVNSDPEETRREIQRLVANMIVALDLHTSRHYVSADAEEVRAVSHRIHAYLMELLK